MGSLALLGSKTDVTSVDRAQEALALIGLSMVADMSPETLMGRVGPAALTDRTDKGECRWIDYEERVGHRHDLWNKGCPWWGCRGR